MWLLTFKESFACRGMMTGMTDEKNEAIALLNYKKKMLCGVFPL